MVKIEVGQVWRADTGGHKMQVVGFDEDGFVLLKRADSPKYQLAPDKAGSGYPAARGEFDRGEWVRIS